MATRIPLPTLLSQALVGFTIEFDNEFEHRMPHRTSSGPAAGSTRGPWLVSMAMWSNFMQFVTEAGVPLRDLEPQARMTNLQGLERWGYVIVEPDPADDRNAPPRSAWRVRTTPAGLAAQAVWRPLAAEIEWRWQSRFGDDVTTGLRAALCACSEDLDGSWPDYLPVVRNTMFASVPESPGAVPIRPEGRDARELPALLSRVLLAFAIEFEQDSELSLPMSANVVRVLDATGVRSRDIPRRAGISKEAVSMVVNFLERRGQVEIVRDEAVSRTKRVRLTRSGLQAQRAHRDRLAVVEGEWEGRFGPALTRLRDPLERLVGDGIAADTPLFAGLQPYPEGWRASLPRPETLPHYPMVLHRGGYPDGS